MEDIGFDPIGLDKIKVSEWLKQDKDNIVIYLDDSIKNSDRVILLNRSYFLNPNVNDIYKKCVIENGALMVSNTYDSEIYYRNIGFYLDKYHMINNTDFVNELKKSRSFRLEKNNIVSEYISNELLELSQIELSHKALKKTFNDDKISILKSKIEFLKKIQNLPYNEEVYFDEILSNALKCYTTSAYMCINNYLRMGLLFTYGGIFKSNCIYNSYFSDGFKEHPNYTRLRFDLTKLKGKTFDFLSAKKNWDKNTQKQKRKLKKSELIKELDQYLEWYKRNINIHNEKKCIYNIIDKINKLDKCFLEMAPRVSDNKFYYRGMTQKYDGLTNIGDNIISTTYISLTTNPNVPYLSAFWNENNNCCYYCFRLQKGLPYVNMKNNTQYKSESEILLPRNLKLTLVDIGSKMRNGKQHDVYFVSVDKISPEQFKIDTGCKKYDLVTLKSLEDPKIKVKEVKKSDTLKLTPKNVVDNLSPTIQKTKLPRCPKGSRRDKKSGLCVKNTQKSTKTLTKPPQLIKPPSLIKPILLKEKFEIITPIKESKPVRMDDVLENLITINGHGGFNPEKIIVPEWCQIMIPHVNGLDSDYTTPDASKDKLYEEDLYKNKYFNYKGGWRLYVPGDQINNLAISIFHDASTCNEIDQYHTLQKPLSSKCKSDTSFNKFCPLYCTKRKSIGGFDYILYNGKRKLKIKACSGYFLKDLFDNLKQSLSKINSDDRKDISPKSNEPILLIPFTCNAKTGSKSNGFDNDNNKTHLTDIYHKLYDERYNPSIMKIDIISKPKISKPKSSKPKKEKVKKHKCRTFKKSKPAPGCDGVSGCKWIPKIGCLENDPDIIKYEIEKKNKKLKT